MKLQDYAEGAAAEIYKVLGVSPTDEQADQSVRVIQNAVIKAVLETRSHFVDVARECCSADQDMAHKIATEVKQANDVLIANLSSLR